MKPLYVLTDSGYYWNRTLDQHLCEDLLMNPTTVDLYIYVRIGKGEISGITGSYIDDTLSAGNAFFERDSEITERKF